VRDVFDSGFYDYDENWCFLTLPRLKGFLEQATLLTFSSSSPAAGTRRRHCRTSPASCWTGFFNDKPGWKKNRDAVSCFAFGETSHGDLHWADTFVAGLNILVVLSMTVTDKARDIAVLRSMGARREQIRHHFLWQGSASERQAH